MVSERGLDVLRVIVQDYVASREPVGSKSIVDRHSFGVSAATIRNDMALLEEEDLIVAPHTSSGRIPTDKGYRLFVNQLADFRPLTAAQRTAIETFLGASADLDEVLGRTVHLLAQLTHQVALVQYPSLTRSRIRHVEIVRLTANRMMTVLITDNGRVEQRLIEVPVAESEAALDDEFLADLRAKLNTLLGGLGLAEAAEKLVVFAEQALSAEPLGSARAKVITLISSALIEQVLANRQEKLVLAGTANLFRTEEDFSGNIFPVLEAIEEQVTLLKLFGEMAPEQNGISVSIGRENASVALEQTSILSTGYASSGSGISRLGVIGSTRMDYSANIGAVRAVARYLSRLLGAH